MSYKKFNLANGTTYQEYLYTDGINHGYTITLTKQNFSPTVNPYTYYYTGSFELPFDNVSSVEIIEVKVGSGTLSATTPITEFGYGGAYYDESDNSIYFYGGDNTLYPTGTDSLRRYALGKVTYKVTLIGQELYGEIYDRLTIDEEEMMPMSNTVEDNNTEQLSAVTATVEVVDDFEFVLKVTNTNSVPVYLTPSSDSHVYLSSSGDVSLPTRWKQAVNANSTNEIVMDHYYGETIDGWLINMTVSSPGYLDTSFYLEN